MSTMYPFPPLAVLDDGAVPTETTVLFPESFVDVDQADMLPEDPLHVRSTRCPSPTHYSR